ncbi:SRPBCC family protein [Paenibacillus sp. sgz500958]|uniref:SRPBCC family protein n=1 Tax=Paenibacillus sp. sgz500958 TaxID=3242475 RepID=UPI0036D256C0
MTVSAGENEVISLREFDYPRELVFEAWKNPEQLARWWGPKGFTNTFHEFDFKPGGQWRFVMLGPDGVDYPNHSVFEEIVPWERIVLHHLNTPEFQIIATFEEAGGRTRMTWRQRFMKAAVFEQVKTYVIEANEQNFDRLSDLLTECSE